MFNCFDTVAPKLSIIFQKRVQGHVPRKCGLKRHVCTLYDLNSYLAAARLSDSSAASAADRT
jgi:hypothetical protein